MQEYTLQQEEPTSDYNEKEVDVGLLKVNVLKGLALALTYILQYEEFLDDYSEKMWILDCSY